MSRTINMGNNSQYVEKAKTAIQNNSISGNKANFPESVDSQQWEEFVNFMDSFLSSQESKSLSVENYRKLEIELSEAKKSNCSSGWQKFRNILSDTANITTIITPIVSFVAVNSNNIAQWIQNLFN